MERDLRSEPEEQEEKAILSLACLYFLKAASENPTVRVYMVDQNALNSMKKSLFYEEQLMKNYPIPIDIENTYIGRNMEYLFRCMAGNESLEPNSIVSYRIISRIADLLMAIPEAHCETMHGEGAIEKLKDMMGERWERKLEDEVKNWSDFEEGARRNIDKVRDNESEKENFIQQHKLISSFDGLNRLINFIFKNENAKGNQKRKFNLTLNDEFSKKINNLQMKMAHAQHVHEEQRVSDQNNANKKPKNQFKSDFQAELQRHTLSAAVVDKKEIARLILEPPSRSAIEMEGLAKCNEITVGPATVAVDKSIWTLIFFSNINRFS